MIKCLFPLGVFLLSTFVQSPAQRYVIKNVNVIPLTRDIVLEDHTLIINNGVIETLGPSKRVKVPKGAPQIDGRGKYVIPGLFDMHVHFFHEQGEYRNTIEDELKVMLMNGITTARIMAGHPVYLNAKEQVVNGNFLGPDLVVASPQLVGRWPWPADFENFRIVDTEEKAVQAVKDFKQAGYDAIKITFMVTRPVYDAVVATAKAEGIKVTGHVGPQVKLPAALAAGQQIEHMDEFIDMLLPDTSYNHGQSVSDMNIWRPKAWATVPHLDESKLPTLVKMVKDAGVYVTPTNFFFFSSFGEGMTDEAYKGRPDYPYIPEVIKQERWHIKERYWTNAPPEASRKRYVELRKKMTFELWKAGVPLMAGSDSPEWFLVPGFSIHDELETFVACGLSPYEALKTATVNAADYLEVGAEKGTIEQGKRADLLLLDANPLADIRNTRQIRMVFCGKNVLTEKDLESLPEELKRLGR